MYVQIRLTGSFHDLRLINIQALGLSIPISVLFGRVFWGRGLTNKLDVTTSTMGYLNTTALASTSKRFVPMEAYASN